METRFLSFEEVLQIHEDQIRRYGGSLGVRDEGLLRSALAQPEAQFGGEYLHPSIAAMAAAYLFHLVQNHPFIDGNKRIGAACAAVFLELNGLQIDPLLDELEDRSGKTRFQIVVLAVAEGVMNKQGLQDWLETIILPAE